MTIRIRTVAYISTAMALATAEVRPGVTRHWEFDGMSACLERLRGLPDWPRGLSAEQAAAYVGVSVPTFLEEVKAGKWPAPQPRGHKGTRKTWDRNAIDEAYDRQSELHDAGTTEEAALARLQ